MKEFVCIWFATAQKWVVMFPNGEIIDKEFGAIGYATNAAYERIGDVAEFECTEDTGQFYRFQSYED